jgi:hypothetical protein
MHFHKGKINGKKYKMEFLILRIIGILLNGVIKNMRHNAFLVCKEQCDIYKIHIKMC